MIRPPFQWALAVVAGLLLASLFRGDSEANAVASSSAAALAAHGGILRREAQLQALETQHRQLAERAALTSDALRHALASGQRIDTIVVLQEIATQDSTAYRQCSVALLSCDQRAALAEAEADTLRVRLSAQLRVSECRVLLFHCPSRTAAAFFGLLAGGAITLWATR